MAPQNPRDMRDWMRTMERMAVQVRAVPAIVSNAVKVVEDKAQDDKARHPAAPIEVEAQTAVYNDPAYRWHLAQLTVDFPDVVFNTDGTKADIQQYELWGYQGVPPENTKEDELPWKFQSSNTDSHFQVQEYTPGTFWTMRVRALGADTIIPGEWSESFQVEMKRDDTAPPQSTAPKLTVGLGTITVEWDKKAVTGEMPADFNHLIVAAGTTASPTTEVARLDRDFWFYVHTGAEYYTPTHFRFRAVDQSGNAGPWSEQATAFTKPLVDKDVILSEIDAGKTRIINAGKIVLDANTTLESKLKANDTALADTNKTLTGAGGLTERLTGAENKLKDVGALTLADGKTLQAKLTESATAISNTNTELTKVVNRVSPLESGLNTLTNTTIPGLQTSVDGKTGILRKTAAPATTDTAPGGTRWEHWSNLNANGKLLGTYRRSESNTWIKDALDPTYIPLLDIGTATVGSLSGGRLVAGSVSADKVLIGLGDNLLLDPYFEDDALNAERIRTSLWSVATNALDGKYLTVSAETTADIAIGNSTRLEVFPVDGNGVWALTYEASGVNRLAAYLNVTYADGSTASGPFIVNLPINGDESRTRGTVYWDFAKFRSASGTPPVRARLSIRRTAPPAGAANMTTNLFFLRLSPATNGELIVNGSITGELINGESVAAKVGSFLTLGVEQLTVTANANLKTAVADRLFANIFATNKLTTNEMIVGKGANLIPWFGNLPAASRTVAPHQPAAGATNHFEGTGGRGGGPHYYVNATAVVPSGTVTEVFRFMPGAAARNGLNNTFDVEANTTYKVSVWVRAGGNYATVPKVKLQAQRYNGTAAYESASAVESNTVTLAFQWQELKMEFKTTDTSASVLLRIMSDQPGVVRIDDPVLVRDGASLIATGGIVADHITASEEMGAKLAKFIKLEVTDLVSTGTANINEAVVTKLFTETFATRKLTAQQVYLGNGANLFPADLTDPLWQRTTGVTFHADGGKTGGSSILLPASTSQVSVFFGSNSQVDRAKMLKLTPGSTYRFRAYVRSDGPVPVFGVSIYARLYGETGTDFIYASGAFGQLVVNEKALPANEWTQLDGMLTVPADATKLYASIGVGTQADAASAARFSDLIVQEGVTPELVVDGAITTKKLTVTEDMTVELLKAHKVKAAEIDTNSLTADTGFVGAMRTTILTAKIITTDMLKSDVITSDLIKGDAIGAKHTLTGPLIRTAASGARSEFTKEGFRVLSSTGTEMVKMGYGISTGMAVRHPATGRMTQLTDMMFGTQVLDGTTVYQNSYTNVFANGHGAVTLRNSNGVPLYFTAYSTQHMLMISLEYIAWVANGLPSAGARENSNGTVRVTLWTRSDQRPPYSNDYWGTSLAQPYRMIGTNTVTWMCVAINLTPGTEYRVQFDIDNHDSTTVQSYLSPRGGTVVSIPI